MSIHVIDPNIFFYPPTEVHEARGEFHDNSTSLARGTPSIASICPAPRRGLKGAERAGTVNRLFTASSCLPAPEGHEAQKGVSHMVGRKHRQTPLKSSFDLRSSLAIARWLPIARSKMREVRRLRFPLGDADGPRGRSA